MPTTRTSKRGGKRSSGGRPPREKAEKLQEHILDKATALFLTQGYGTTSIEAVAKSAGISKRTFYHRYNDKGELFGAVVHRLISQLRPPASVPIFEGKTLEDIFTRLAQMILHAAITPQALALQRVIVAEATRFPELAHALAAQHGRQDAIDLIGGLLARETQAGRLHVTNAPFAAEQFLQMVMSVPQRRAMGLGKPMSETELEAWGKDTVHLFLRGCRHI